MKKRILLLLTLLLMCVLIPLQKTSAQHPAPTLAVQGDSLKTTDINNDLIGGESLI